jgi:hypothetical protein
MEDYLREVRLHREGYVGLIAVLVRRVVRYAVCSSCMIQYVMIASVALSLRL